MEKELVIPEGTNTEGMVFAPGVKLGDTLYVSGATGSKDGALVGDDILSQARQALLNVERVLDAAGSSRDKVVKVSCFLKHVERDFAGWNAAFREFFGDNPPARTTVSGDMASPDALIEIDLIAGV